MIDSELLWFDKVHLTSYGQKRAGELIAQHIFTILGLWIFFPFLFALFYNRKWLNFYGPGQGKGNNIVLSSWIIFGDTECNQVGPQCLIQLKFITPVIFLFPLRLFLFFKQIVAHNQIIHFCTHETTIGIIRSTDNGLPPDIKTGVNN